VPRPWSRTGGWMPRARSRSSAMASLALRWAASTSSGARSMSASVIPVTCRRASPWPGPASWRRRPSGPAPRRAGPARSGAAPQPSPPPSWPGPAPAHAPGAPAARPDRAHRERSYLDARGTSAQDRWADTRVGHRASRTSGSGGRTVDLLLAPGEHRDAGDRTRRHRRSQEASRCTHRQTPSLPRNPSS
jgi:hypothetical protein